MFFWKPLVDADLGDIKRTAAIRVQRRIRTARQSMAPMEGRGVLVDGLPSSLSSAWGPSSPPAPSAPRPSADGAWPAVTSGHLLGLSTDSDEQPGGLMSGNLAL